MRYSSKAAVEYDLSQHYKLEEEYKKELSMRSDYKGCYIKLVRTDYKGSYYSIRKSGEKNYRYIGADNDPDIIGTREYRFYEEGLRVIKANIQIMEKFLAVYRSTRADSINDLLGNAYRFRLNSKMLNTEPEIDEWLCNMKKEKERYPIFDEAGLKITTFDGSLVRSRAEAFHYEAFYIYDVPAVFEYPYEIENDLLRPDFTTLNVYTMKPVIWEHLGFWFHKDPHKREKYRYENLHRIDEYSKIGFLPESNLMLTFGADENKFDVQSIHRKIAMMALPPPSEETIDMLKRL